MKSLMHTYFSHRTAPPNRRRTPRGQSKRRALAVWALSTRTRRLVPVTQKEPGRKLASRLDHLRPRPTPTSRYPKATTASKEHRPEDRIFLSLLLSRSLLLSLSLSLLLSLLLSLSLSFSPSLALSLISLSVHFQFRNIVTSLQHEECNETLTLVFTITMRHYLIA